MALSYGFFNAELTQSGQYDRVYAAEQFAEYFHLIVSNGVFPDPATQLQVVASDTPDMNVNVSDGYGWINGYFAKNEGLYPLAIQAASGSLNRVDAVVLRWVNASRSMELAIKTGTAASSPVTPSLQRDTDVYEIMLATVTVAAGVTSISQSAITDKRSDTSVCGWVTGAVQNIDTTNLFAQYDAAFQAWFEDIQAQLEGDVATNLINRINAVDAAKVNISDKASEEEVESGVSDSKWVSPLKLSKVTDRIGDIRQSIRTSLGPNWALCNGDSILYSDNPTLCDLLDGTLWKNKPFAINTNGYQCLDICWDGTYFVALVLENNSAVTGSIFIYYSKSLNGPWTKNSNLTVTLDFGRAYGGKSECIRWNGSTHVMTYHLNDGVAFKSFASATQSGFNGSGDIVFSRGKGYSLTGLHVANGVFFVYYGVNGNGAKYSSDGVTFGSVSGLGGVNFKLQSICYCPSIGAYFSVQSGGLYSFNSLTSSRISVSGPSIGTIIGVQWDYTRNKLLVIGTTGAGLYTVDSLTSLTEYKSIVGTFDSLSEYANCEVSIFGDTAYAVYNGGSSNSNTQCIVYRLDLDSGTSEKVVSTTSNGRLSFAYESMYASGDYTGKN